MAVITEIACISAHTPFRLLKTRMALTRDCYEPVHLGRSDTPPNGPPPSNLNDKVHSLTSVELARLDVPVGDLGVIDCLKGSLLGRALGDERGEKTDGPIQLGLRGGGEDDASTSDKSKLGGEEGDTACSQTEDGLAGLKRGGVAEE